MILENSGLSICDGHSHCAPTYSRRQRYVALDMRGNGYIALVRADDPPDTDWPYDSIEITHFVLDAHRVRPFRAVSTDDEGVIGTLLDERTGYVACIAGGTDITQIDMDSTRESVWVVA